MNTLELLDGVRDCFIYRDRGIINNFIKFNFGPLFLNVSYLNNSLMYSATKAQAVDRFHIFDFILFFSFRYGNRT